MNYLDENNIITSHQNRMYLCIDLKSFYASVECVERGLDPLTTNLAVADPERSEKTICLAISPAMKELGVPNRCRVFQIPGTIEYIKAPPRMRLYMEYSANIYAIYLRYIAKEDIHVYSIDEAFLDVTDYLDMYQLTAKELAVKIMDDIRNETGVTATCGIGTNLYLAKIALDITAKHVKDNIGYLDEELYCKTLWRHRPLNDFWRVGKGTVRRLESIGILTMEDVAKADEEILYNMFGIDAELLIDHAWGREITTIHDIKTYTTKSTSISSGQVLPRDYDFQEGLLIIKEMTDNLCLELLDKGLVTESISLDVGYSNEIQKPHAKGTASMTVCTSSTHAIMPYVVELYSRILDRNLPIRRMNLTFHNVRDEVYEQYDLFTNVKEIVRDRKLQKAALEIKKKFGKNALVRGMDLQDAGTTMERNRQIGGHKSGD
ncbi:MAG TPA: DNA repair protein [Lachnospiraceae bacterium]|nr:DNA repair protein [uncultured Lachnoclostridium sp.]HAU86846.1 DNA repair protein [Lachnospiraceae bacterium]